jgi:hypothetical protein
MPYIWMVVGTGPPAGLTLAGNGTLKGMALCGQPPLYTQGTWSVQVQVADSSTPQQTARATIRLTVTQGSGSCGPGDKVQSGGSSKCRVPRFGGTNLSTIRRRLITGHCSVGRVTYSFNRARKGTVIAENQRVGRILPHGYRVGVTISRGRRR